MTDLRRVASGARSVTYRVPPQRGHDPPASFFLLRATAARESTSPQRSQLNRGMGHAVVEGTRAVGPRSRLRTRRRGPDLIDEPASPSMRI